MKDILIVGSGFAGCVIANQLALKGYQVHIIEKRSHIGGNAYDYYDTNGILVHKYGPHIFHTNSDQIFNFLSNFTEWNLYEHRVLSYVNGDYYPFPINQTTINRLYNQNFNDIEVKQFLDNIRISHKHPTNSEDAILNQVGEELYYLFFYNYTKKQWGCEPSLLDSSIASRIPVRYTKDDRYFTDKYQFMPSNGYTQLFNNLIDYKNIKISLNTEFNKSKFKYDHLIYTGPIDAYFSYCLGYLPYRSLRFEHQNYNVEYIQDTGTVNYPNNFDFTRITEFKHLTNQQSSTTSIVKEYPCFNTNEPYYPISTLDNRSLYKQYFNLSKKETNVSFIGRLAQYQYYNMDQVVAAALKFSKGF